MKNILLILLTIFVFFGCAPKKEIVIKPSEPVVVKPEVKEEPELFDLEPSPIEEEPLVVDEGIDKLAVIFPSRIVGKYAKRTIATVSSFLIYTNKDFDLETFDTYDEDYANIFREIKLLKEKGFTKVIAMFTQKGFNILNSFENISDIKFYFPLINKEEILTEKQNFIFGGISYKDQLTLLNTISNGKNSMFYINSYRGNKLKQTYLDTFENIDVIKEIDKKMNNYKYIMDDERIIGSTVLLNTSIVKSSIILSQLLAYEVEPAIILSTQVNYTPLLIKLTQPVHRENLYIANSISEVNPFIEEYINILGGDVVYNWVDYSSLVGINYLLEDDKFKVTSNIIEDNQVLYKPVLYKATAFGFEKIEED